VCQQDTQFSLNTKVLRPELRSAQKLRGTHS
jgi:hypothetical protein